MLRNVDLPVAESRHFLLKRLPNGSENNVPESKKPSALCENVIRDTPETGRGHGKILDCEEMPRLDSSPAADGSDVTPASPEMPILVPFVFENEDSSKSPGKLFSPNGFSCLNKENLNFAVHAKSKKSLSFPSKHGMPPLKRTRGRPRKRVGEGRGRRPKSKAFVDATPNHKDRRLQPVVVLQRLSMDSEVKESGRDEESDDSWLQWPEEYEGCSYDDYIDEADPTVEKLPEVDFIDGVEFLSFYQEGDVKSYALKTNQTIVFPSDSASPNDFDPGVEDLHMLKDDNAAIVPTKTKDITQIKGWKRKIFIEDNYSSTPNHLSPAYLNEDSLELPDSTLDDSSQEPVKLERSSTQSSFYAPSPTREADMSIPEEADMPVREEAKKPIHDADLLFHEDAKKPIHIAAVPVRDSDVPKREAEMPVIDNVLKLAEQPQKNESTKLTAFSSSNLDDFLEKHALLQVNFLQECEPAIEFIPSDHPVLKVGTLRVEDKEEMRRKRWRKTSIPYRYRSEPSNTPVIPKSVPVKNIQQPKQQKRLKDNLNLKNERRPETLDKVRVKQTSFGADSVKKLPVNLVTSPTENVKRSLVFVSEESNMSSNSFSDIKTKDNYEPDDQIFSPEYNQDSNERRDSCLRNTDFQDNDMDYPVLQNEADIEYFSIEHYEPMTYDEETLQASAKKPLTIISETVWSTRDSIREEKMMYDLLGKLKSPDSYLISKIKFDDESPPESNDLLTEEDAQEVAKFLYGGFDSFEVLVEKLKEKQTVFKSRQKRKRKFEKAARLKAEKKTAQLETVQGFAQWRRTPTDAQHGTGTMKRRRKTVATLLHGFSKESKRKREIRVPARFLDSTGEVERKQSVEMDVPCKSNEKSETVPSQRQKFKPLVHSPAFHISNSAADATLPLPPVLSRPASPVCNRPVSPSSSVDGSSHFSGFSTPVSSPQSPPRSPTPPPKSCASPEMSLSNKNSPTTQQLIKTHVSIEPENVNSFPTKKAKLMELFDPNLVTEVPDIFENVQNVGVNGSLKGTNCSSAADATLTIPLKGTSANSESLKNINAIYKKITSKVIAAQPEKPRLEALSSCRESTPHPMVLNISAPIVESFKALIPKLPIPRLPARGAPLKKKETVLKDYTDGTGNNFHVRIQLGNGIHTITPNNSRKIQKIKMNLNSTVNIDSKAREAIKRHPLDRERIPRPCPKNVLYLIPLNEYQWKPPDNDWNKSPTIKSFIIRSAKSEQIMFQTDDAISMPLAAVATPTISQPTKEIFLLYGTIKMLPQMSTKELPPSGQELGSKSSGLFISIDQQEFFLSCSVELAKAPVRLNAMIGKVITSLLLYPVLKDNKESPISAKDVPGKPTIPHDTLDVDFVKEVNSNVGKINLSKNRPEVSSTVYVNNECNAASESINVSPNVASFGESLLKKELCKKTPTSSATNSSETTAFKVLTSSSINYSKFNTPFKASITSPSLSDVPRSIQPAPPLSTQPSRNVNQLLTPTRPGTQPVPIPLTAANDNPTGQTQHLRIFWKEQALTIETGNNAPVEARSLKSVSLLQSPRNILHAVPVKSGEVGVGNMNPIVLNAVTQKCATYGLNVQKPAGQNSTSVIKVQSNPVKPGNRPIIHNLPSSVVANYMGKSLSNNQVAFTIMATPSAKPTSLLDCKAQATNVARNIAPRVTASPKNQDRRSHVPQSSALANALTAYVSNSPEYDLHISENEDGAGCFTTDATQVENAMSLLTDDGVVLLKSPPVGSQLRNGLLSQNRPTSKETGQGTVVEVNKGHVETPTEQEINHPFSHETTANPDTKEDDEDSDLESGLSIIDVRTCSSDLFATDEIHFSEEAKSQDVSVEEAKSNDVSVEEAKSQDASSVPTRTTKPSPNVTEIELKDSCDEDSNSLWISGDGEPCFVMRLPEDLEGDGNFSDGPAVVTCS